MLPSQKPFRGIQLNRTHPLAKGLVGCWLFNEMTGETVFDSSGHGNNGTLENDIAWGNGGLEFDGVNDYVEVVDNSTLDLLNGFTILMVINIESNTDEYSHQIVSKSNGASSEGGWQLSQEGSSGGINKIKLFLPDGTAPSPTFVTTNAIPINMDVTLCVTWDGTVNSNSIKTYFNTIQQAGTETNYGTTNITNNLPLLFGMRTNGNLYLGGKIGYIHLYNRALPGEEIAWLYREPYAMFEPTFNPAILYSAAPPVGAIMNQFQRANIGADLYNGAIVA